MLEPFITAQAQQLKLRPVLFNYVETIPTGALASYFDDRGVCGQEPRRDRPLPARDDPGGGLQCCQSRSGARYPSTKFTKIALAAAQKVALAAYDQRGNEGTRRARQSRQGLRPRKAVVWMYQAARLRRRPSKRLPEYQRSRPYRSGATDGLPWPLWQPGPATASAPHRGMIAHQLGRRRRPAAENPTLRNTC